AAGLFIVELRVTCSSMGRSRVPNLRTVRRPIAYVRHFERHNGTIRQGWKRAATAPIQRGEINAASPSPTCELLNVAAKWQALRALIRPAKSPLACRKSDWLHL